MWCVSNFVMYMQKMFHVNLERIGCMKQFVHCGRLLKLITLFCLLNPECRLPPWTIHLVVMGFLALLFAVVGSIVTIIHGIYVCQRLPEKCELHH